MYGQNLNQTPFECLNSGTGASAIYPLLAARLEPRLEMFATGDDYLYLRFNTHDTETEIDSHSLEHARLNLERNPSLSVRIRPLAVDPTKGFFEDTAEVELVYAL
jgi:23S rRNA A1618 N6-methylase RlmF